MQPRSANAIPVYDHSGNQGTREPGNPTRPYETLPDGHADDVSLGGMREHTGGREPLYSANPANSVDSRGSMQGIPTPEDILPHRPPFLFLSEVTYLVPGKEARGYWQLTGSEDFFSGHFPGRPTLPGVLMVESLAQLGAVAVLGHPSYEGKLPLFGGIDKARFRNQVLPGDRLDLEVSLERLSARGGKGNGLARVGGKLACQVGLLFVVVDG